MGKEMNSFTRKILAPFDPQRPDKILQGILYPSVNSETITKFQHANTGKEWDVGMVVFLGREIMKEDIFAKIIDSGQKVSSVNLLLTCLDTYIKQLQVFRIGDIVGVESTANGFELVKRERPRILKSKLPS